MLLFVTECFRVLQSVTEYYRVFLEHLLGPISGLVFLNFGQPEDDVICSEFQRVVVVGSCNFEEF